MRRFWILTGCLLLFVQAAACASTTPPRRIADYLGPQSMEEIASTPLPPRPIHAGLVIVPDTLAPQAAPLLPDEALNRLKERLQQEMSEMTPIVIDTIIPAEGVRPDGDPSELSRLGKQHGVDYLVMIIASSTEQEYPMTLLLGWVTHAQPGWRRDNWSLLEVALVDTKTGQALLRAEGRGFATLDRPAAPGINQWYPVIWLRPQEPARRYWPPTYAGAPNTLRVVAMNEAAKRLVLNLQDAWIQKRQLELEAAG
jgi:rhombotail lipoprotein